MIREALGQQSVAKLPAAAVVVALAGLVDAMYLTVKHYTEEPVPCSIIEGCEMVLTSSYAEIAGVPLAALGAAAYFTAFSLALLAAFGNRFAWTFFGIQSIIMALVTAWLIYLQAAVIGAFCQFCLISAATSFALVILYLVSRFTQLK
ncbi:hypothetical protein BH18ACI3_BH18ACI3_07400 [soil metagenome]